MNNCSYLQQRINIATIFATNQINQPIVVAGFLRKIRKLGKLCFVNLVDVSGALQLVFQDNLIEQIVAVNKESVICVRGVVKPRLQPNPQQQFGEYEMQVSEFCVLNQAHSLPPFNIDTTINALEDTLLKYRYLDLRSNLGTVLQQRSRIINIMRQFFLTHNFTEITTPILGRSTPEGARDFLVPIRTKTKAAGYALPQSPQLYKQLLMVGGLERYFQFATNFRDEDLRADRQPEFMQLDLEVSY